MKKIVLTFIAFAFAANVSIQHNSYITDNRKQNTNPIDSVNTLCAMDNLESIESIEQDTVLNNISKILLTNKTYKNSAGVYNEDSIRSLLYRSGIIDYQYEIQEVSDKDTASVFKAFSAGTSNHHTRMGYYKSVGRHILFKTKSYLKFDHGRGYTHPHKVDLLNPHAKTTVAIYTDSIFHYFKILEPDEYYYQFYDRIPSSIDNMDNIEKKKVQTNRGVSMFGEYDFVIKSAGQETDMYLIISNKNNERVVVIK